MMAARPGIAEAMNARDTDKAAAFDSLSSQHSWPVGSPCPTRTPNEGQRATYEPIRPGIEQAMSLDC
jgi:hypothetical protein